MNAHNEANNVVKLLQDVLRKAGCLQRLSALLKSYKLANAVGHQVDSECLQCALNAVNNLAMNMNNQSLLAVSSAVAEWLFCLMFIIINELYGYCTNFIQIVSLYICESDVSKTCGFDFSENLGNNRIWTEQELIKFQSESNRLS